MVREHHWLSGHESEQTPGDSERQGGLACYSPWAHKESDTTWWLNSNNNNVLFKITLSSESLSEWSLTKIFYGVFHRHQENGDKMSVPYFYLLKKYNDKNKQYRESNTLRQFILFCGSGDLWRKSCSLWLPPAPLVVD